MRILIKNKKNIDFNVLIIKKIYFIILKASNKVRMLLKSFKIIKFVFLILSRHIQ